MKEKKKEKTTQQEASGYLPTIKLQDSKCSNFEQLLCCTCWSHTGDGMVPARDLCLIPANDLNLRPIQISSFTSTFKQVLFDNKNIPQLPSSHIQQKWNKTYYVNKFFLLFLFKAPPASCLPLLLSICKDKTLQQFSPPLPTQAGMPCCIHLSATEPCFCVSCS